MYRTTSAFNAISYTKFYMKVFIKQIVSEWGFLRAVHSDVYYNTRTRRYTMRRALIITNKELSFIVRQLLTSILSLVIVVGSIGAAYFMVLTLTISDISDFLSAMTGFTISFISTLVAAGIFITTLHRQSSNKTIDENAGFYAEISKHKNTMITVFNALEGMATDQEKVELFKASPCDSVLDQSDYEWYKRWHLDKRGFLMQMDLSYNNYLRYPYDTASSVNWGRAGFLTSGCLVAKELISRSGYTDRSVKHSVNELYASAKRYQAADARRWQYIPVEFVGKRLYRVVVYSLLAIMVALVANTFKNYSLDILPAFNVELVDKMITIAIVGMLLSTYIILRYVFMFISYLRNSTSYFSPIGNLYIHEQDEVLRSKTGM